jgi:lipid-A-disaccharide synthase
MKYYIIAGEASGDLHGSNLIKALVKADPEANVRCWGGDLMKAEGATLVKHYRDTAVMGIFEVIANFRNIARNFKFCHADILSFQPDVVILIDYPGFNLRIAKFAKENGLKVFYYISPKVWAWKESRVKVIKKYVDKMFVIFPFEKPFYARHNYEVEYEGNPLIDAIEERKLTLCKHDDFILKNGLTDLPIIALLPGSRKQEITRLLPIMTAVAKQFNDYQFIVAGTSIFSKEFYSGYMVHNVKIVFDQTYELLNNSFAGVIASGTATLETALFNVPQVVCYRVNPASFIIGRALVPLKYFSLVNIIMNEEVVKELLQYNLVKDISDELSLILNDQKHRAIMIDNYSKLRLKCGEQGASKRVGELMVSYLKDNVQM